ncbi:MAG: ABC transporter permease subunit [Desulfomonile tiedjei]|nr:ABC transporter permease subunit [Desulfomonile tiedjei]
MAGWYPVFRKETANFFVSPIAYAVIAIFLLLSGFFFWANVTFMSWMSLQAANNPMISARINLNDVVIRPLVQNMAILILFLMPLLTMRLFSEEKKSGTIELLLTYPVTDVGVLLGKFLGAILLLVVMLAGTFPFAIMLAGIGRPDYGVFLTGYLGLLLMGGAFMALGMFISSLTENQIVAAAISFGAAILCWVLSWSSSLTDETTGAVLRQLSILEHVESLNKGILSLADISFFVLFTAFFLFLTLRSIETYRWRG